MDPQMPKYLNIESDLGAPVAQKSTFVQPTHHLTSHLFQKNCKKICMLAKHRINSPSHILATTPCHYRFQPHPDAVRRPPNSGHLRQP
jgi:hypothetical protein